MKWDESGESTMKLRSASESVGCINSVGPLTVSPQFSPQKGPSLLVVCEQIERVREKLDVVLNERTSKVDLHRLLNIDNALKQLKIDIGFPRAGL
jgi:hypothetical protein